MVGGEEQGIEQLRKLFEDVDARLSDPDLTDGHRIRYVREAKSLLHEVFDLRGFLTQRSQVEVSGPGLAAFSTLIEGADGQLYGLEQAGTP